MKNKVKNQIILIVITMLVFMMGCEPVEDSTDNNTNQSNNSSQITGTFSYGTGKVSVQASTKLDAEISPTWDGNETAEQLDEDNIEYSIVPTASAEPAFTSTGLDFNTSTGTISGTASATLSSTEYTITATGKGKFTGEITGTVRITIVEEVTGSFLYTSITATKDIALTEDAMPQWTGATAGQTVEYSAANLPAGLSINATTGAISGTATVPQISTEYTITATGTNLYTGNKTATISIAINASSIGTISYTVADIKGEKGSTITASLRKWSDDAPSDISATYAINTTPAKESFNFNTATGLNFDTSTGAISGELTVPQTSTQYTIIATAKAPYIGSTSVTIQIAITTPLTGTFSYTNISATKDIALTEDANLPQWTVAGQTVEYTIAPTDTALPTGLGINATTGAIIGTPTALQISTEYTITANAKAPYTAPAQTITATVQIAITTPITGTFSYGTGKISVINSTALDSEVSPTWDGGQIVGQLDTGNIEYSIAPTDSAGQAFASTGLDFNTSTGAISGTASATPSSTEYTITATAKAPYTDPNPKITATVQIIITVPITGTFSYTNITGTRGTTITDSTYLPTWINKTLGQIVEHTIAPTDPALPTGLSINATTGAIIGTPTAQQASAEYTITATAKTPYTDPDPKITATVQIAITTPLTGTFSYTNITASKDIALTEDANLPQWTVADQTVEYTIASTDTALPTGLSINATTGAIIGTPTALQASAEYIITANAKVPYTDPTPKITATVQIAITAPITGTFSYTNITGTKGTTITDSTYLPTWIDKTSGQTVGYTIAPDLPTGLIFNTSTGAISGELTVPQASEYTITANAKEPYIDSPQPITATISIKITATIDGSFSYSATISATEDTAIADLTPLWSGRTDSNQKIKYIIRPGLPKGLVFDTSTGVLSGTPTEVALESEREYSIEARGETPYTGTISTTSTINITLKPLVSYSSIASGTSGTSSPVFEGGMTPSGRTYSIATTSESDFTPTTDPALPTIDNQGIITVDTNTTAGTYVVTINDGSEDLTAYFYVTTSPTGPSDLKTAISTGQGHFGDTADFNYIQTDGMISMGGVLKHNTTFNGDISLWNISNVEHIYQMFWGATAFNGDISQWDTSKVLSMIYLFRDATSFNGNLPWDTSSVTIMKSMFNGATVFNGDISSWDTSGVTDMYGVFWHAHAFNGDISGWDTSSVETVHAMFSSAKAFNSDISLWNMSSVTTMKYMFQGASVFNQNLDAWATKLKAEVLMTTMFHSSGLAGNEPCWYSTSGIKTC